MQTIYVGNLPFSASEDDLKAIFAPYGEVASVTLILDQDTGRSRGFGFVEMAPAVAGPAIDALDGSGYEGHVLRVNEARDRGAKPPRRPW